MFLAGHHNGQNNTVQPTKHETNKMNSYPSQYASYPAQEYHMPTGNTLLIL